MGNTIADSKLKLPSSRRHSLLILEDAIGFIVRFAHQVLDQLDNPVLEQQCDNNDDGYNQYDLERTQPLIIPPERSPSRCQLFHSISSLSYLD
jgi:hypothetical protein